MGYRGLRACTAHAKPEKSLGWVGLTHHRFPGIYPYTSTFTSPSRLYQKKTFICICNSVHGFIDHSPLQALFVARFGRPAICSTTLSSTSPFPQQLFTCTCSSSSLDLRTEISSYPCAIVEMCTCIFPIHWPCFVSCSTTDLIQTSQYGYAAARWALPRAYCIR